MLSIKKCYSQFVIYGFVDVYSEMTPDENNQSSYSSEDGKEKRQDRPGSYEPSEYRPAHDKTPDKDERGRVYLPHYRERLEKAIIADPKKAWEMCTSDKYYAMVRRQAIDALSRSPLYKDNTNLKAFQEMGEKALNDLFVKGVSVVDQYGLALTVDLIIEAWRMDSQQQFLLMAEDRYIEMLKVLEKQAIDPIELTIAKEAIGSISDLVEYERNNAQQYLPIIDRFIELVDKYELIKALADENGLKPSISALFLALSNNMTLRNHLLRGFAKELSRFILEHFDELSEEEKYVLALYPRVLQSLWQLSKPRNQEKMAGKGQEEDLNTE